MRIELDRDDLRPLISEVVSEVMRQQKDDAAKLNGRLAYSTSEACAALGICGPHVIRDARIRGELVGCRCEKKIVYEVAELKKWLEKSRL